MKHPIEELTAAVELIADELRNLKAERPDSYPGYNEHVCFISLNRKGETYLVVGEVGAGPRNWAAAYDAPRAMALAERLRAEIAKRQAELDKLEGGK